MKMQFIFFTVLIWQSFSANYRTRKPIPALKLLESFSFLLSKLKFFRAKTFDSLSYWSPQTFQTSSTLLKTSTPTSGETFLPTSLKNTVNQALSVSMLLLKYICIKDLPILAISGLIPFLGTVIHQVFSLPKHTFSPFSMDSFLQNTNLLKFF